MNKKISPNGKYSLPLVSVIMPVYNAGDFLVEAIESILTQTYQNFEFIIVDDSSIDGSWKIIQKYKKAYSDKIKITKTKTNLNRGGDVCANIALRQAHGDYIARMDADDISLSNRLETQVAFLEENKDVFLIGAQANVIDKKGKIIGVKKEPLAFEDIKKAYFTYHPIIHPSVMLRKKIGNKHFSYKIKYSANNDLYTFYMLLCKGYRFANLPDILLYYRIHSKNNTFINIRENFFNTLYIRLNMVKDYGYRPSIIQWIVNLFQLVLFLLLPEKILKLIYLVVKGIVRTKVITFPTRQVRAGAVNSLAYFL